MLWLVFAHPDEEIGRLDILVKHLLVMSVLQRVGGLLEQGRDLGGREWRSPAAKPEPAGQGALFTVGHHQVGELRVVERFFSIGVQDRKSTRLNSSHSSI